MSGDRNVNWPVGAWSHSRWRTLRRCPRAHHLKYVERLYPIGLPNSALEIGSAFHHGLEVVGRAAALGKETTVGLWETASKLARARCHDPASGLEATRLLASYRQHYGANNAGFDGDYDVIAVEEVLPAPKLFESLGGFAAIADVVLRERDGGGLVVGEYKTAARSPGGSTEELARKWAVEDQVLSLAYCAQVHFGELPKVLRRMTTKAKLVNHINVPITLTPGAVDEWAENAKELELMAGLKCANYDSCAPANSYVCDYFDHCHPGGETKFERRLTRDERAAKQGTEE